jgi:hypothetical protein
MMLQLQFQQTIGGLARYPEVLEVECAEVAHRTSSSSSSQGEMHVVGLSLEQQGQFPKCALRQMYKQQQTLYQQVQQQRLPRTVQQQELMLCQSLQLPGEHCRAQTAKTSHLQHQLQQQLLV